MILWLAVSAAGQEHSQLRGLIQDVGGSPIAGAQVVAHNSWENTDRACVIGADGSFAMDDLKPGHYQFKARKRGLADSPVAEADLPEGGDVTLNLTLGAHLGFLKRLSNVSTQDWKGTASSGPEPPRRASSSPLDSPPFPNSDWSYGGSPEIAAGYPFGTVRGPCADRCGWNGRGVPCARHATWA